MLEKVHLFGISMINFDKFFLHKQFISLLKYAGRNMRTKQTRHPQNTSRGPKEKLPPLLTTNLAITDHVASTNHTIGLKNSVQRITPDP